MKRKPFLLVLVLLLGAAACGRAEGTAIDLGSGVRFVAEVVDPLNDAGRYASTVTTSDGRPLVAYFGLPEDLPEGVIADSRPIGSPSIPGVMLATRNADGVWSRGAIALVSAIPNVDIAFAPAFDEAIGNLTAGNVTGLDIAIDGQDVLHAAWGSVDGLWYATGSSDPASTMQWTVDKVFDSPPQGLSIAVTDGGDPYLTFVSGGEVLSAEGGVGSWRLNPVAPTGSCADGCVTDTAIIDGAPAIAFTTQDGAVALATTGEAGWTAEPLGPGSSPSLAADGTSSVVAYADGTSILVARGDADPYEVAVLADEVVRGTSVAVDGAGTVSVAWSASGSGLGLAQGDISPGGGFDPVDIGTVLGAGAPDVTATEDGVFLAWQETADRDVLLGSLGKGEFAFALPSPTVEPKRDGGSTMPPTNCVPAENGSVTVVAVGVAFTDGSCISVPAGEPFQILFDNKDDAAQVGQHNIAIFPSANDLANPIFRGDLVSGPAEVTYDVDALDAGEYFFHCDVHPQMVGKVVAEGAGGGGGGGGGGGASGGVTTSVTAMGLAFDTSTINLKAGKASTLTMDNQDAGTPHNIAIYPSATDLTNPLFRGELVTGVATIDYEIPALDAGEYYFQCDVHPTMKGTVVVG